MMKLSVFTVVTPDLTPEQLVDAAKDAGIDGIEWRFKGIAEEAKNQAPSFWGNNLCSIDPELPQDSMLVYKNLTESRGLEVVSVTPYLNVDDLDATEHVFSTAKLLGAKMIRVGVAGYDGTAPYPALYEKTVRYLKEAERLAKQYGVKGIVETHHNTISPSAGLAHRLVSHCDPDHIGVLFDPGNMVHEGYENLKMGLELLGPYLAHVHVKNTHWVTDGQRADGTVNWKSDWAPMGGGIIDFAKVLEYLKQVGYDGYLGIEDFSKQYESRELLKQYAKFVKERL
ncbi:MAG: xylose isomerase [Paenibacillaceae bacterium]|jgi:sugar phosphate isomerase/epimerase|nr:xylose isomerase [Paenibacillaceae bacterium]